MIQRNQFDMPPTVCIQLLEWCNLTCINCRSDSSPRMKGRLDKSLVLNLIESLAKLGEWRISLTGGEPTYYEYLGEVLDKLNEVNFPFSLTTNGLVKKGFIEKHSRLFSENSRIHVSIDGNSFIHELNRGENTYKKSLSFIKKATKVFPFVSITTVLYEDPSIWFDDFFNDIKSFSIDNMTFISPVNEGRFKKRFNEEYIARFEYVKNYLDKKENVQFSFYFLDFNSIEEKYFPVTFVNHFGKVFHPFVKSTDIQGPVSDLSDKDIGQKIYRYALNYSKTIQNSIV